MNRTIAPSKSPSVFHLPSFEYTKLKNNVDFYSIRSGAEPIFKLELVLDAGSKYQDKLFQSNLTSKIIKESTQKYKGDKLAEAIDFFGAHLITQTDKDYTSITLYGLTEHLEDLLNVLEQVYFYPEFDAKRFEYLLQTERASYLMNSQKNSYRAAQLTYECFFDSKSLYHSKFDEHDFSKLHLDDLLEFHKKQYNYAPKAVFVSGNLSDKALNRIQEFCLSFNQKSVSPLKKNVLLSKQQEIFEFKENAMQSAVRMVLPSLSKSDKDYAVFRLAIMILGGYFGSRLMQNIREDKGYTYGISAYIQSLQKQSMVTISTEVGVEYTQDTIVEIHKEIQELKDKLVSTKELDRVKSYFSGVFLRWFDGAFQSIDMLKATVLSDLKFDFYEHYIEQIKQVDPKKLQDVFNQKFKDDLALEIVVGKK